MNEYTFDEITVGAEESFVKTVTKEMEESFRMISGDVNPLHSDDDFAVSVSNGKFTGHVSFGMLTASLFSAFAGVYLPGKYSLIHSIDGLSFTNPVYAGDVLTVTGKVTDKVDDLKLIVMKVSIKNQNNKTVSRATMKVLVLK